MTYICNYRPDGKSFVREKEAEMRPKLDDYPPKSPHDLEWGGSEAFHDATSNYLRHIALLKQYAAPFITPEMAGREMELGKDFEIVWFVKTTSYQGEGGRTFKTYKEAESKYNEWSKYNGQLQSFTYPPVEVASTIDEIPIPKEESAHLTPAASRQEGKGKKEQAVSFIEFIDCWEDVEKDMPESDRWLAIYKPFGIALTAPTKEKAFEQVVISIKVLLAYKNKITPPPAYAEDESELWEEAKESLSNGLYSISTESGKPMLNTNQCDEFSSVFVADLKSKFSITRK